MEFGAALCQKWKFPHVFELVTRWHHEQLAHLIRRLAETDDGDGTLLDNSMLVLGSNLADGHDHGEEDLPILVAGRAGGSIRTGRAIRYREKTSMSGLHLAALRRLGVPAERFADADEALAEFGG